MLTFGRHLCTKVSSMRNLMRRTNSVIDKRISTSFFHRIYVSCIFVQITSIRDPTFRVVSPLTSQPIRNNLKDVFLHHDT